MNSQEAREKLAVACGCYGSMTFLLCEHLVANIDAYGDARELEVINEILENGYSLEQIEDMRRNVIEGVE